MKCRNYLPVHSTCPCSARYILTCSNVRQSCQVRQSSHPRRSFKANKSQDFLRSMQLTPPRERDAQRRGSAQLSSATTRSPAKLAYVYPENWHRVNVVVTSCSPPSQTCSKLPWTRDGVGWLVFLFSHVCQRPRRGLHSSDHDI